jgi:hypothetical protein
MITAMPTARTTGRGAATPNLRENHPAHGDDFADVDHHSPYWNGALILVYCTRPPAHPELVDPVDLVDVFFDNA